MKRIGRREGKTGFSLSRQRVGSRQSQQGEFKRESNRVLVSTSHRLGAVPPGGGLGVEGEGRKQIIVT